MKGGIELCLLVVGGKINQVACLSGTACTGGGRSRLAVGGRVACHDCCGPQTIALGLGLYHVSTVQVGEHQDF
jgi:hypothetical protein